MKSMYDDVSTLGTEKRQINQKKTKEFNNNKER